MNLPEFIQEKIISFLNKHLYYLKIPENIQYLSISSVYYFYFQI